MAIIDTSIDIDRQLTIHTVAGEVLPEEISQKIKEYCEAKKLGKKVRGWPRTILLLAWEELEQIEKDIKRWQCFEGLYKP